MAVTKQKLELARSLEKKRRSDIKQLRKQREIGQLHLQKVERICEIRAQELEVLRANLSTMGKRIAELEGDLAGVQVGDRIRGHADMRPLFAMSLAGEGIEIGALHRPLSLLPDVVVRYVDLRSRDENIAKFPEIPAGDVVGTDIVCDGQLLATIADESQDFVIANHMLEHCVNPLRTLENFLRVLRPYGKIFLSVPDKRFTFDYQREVTPWKHIRADYETGRGVEDREVYDEYRRCVDPDLDPDEAVASRREIHHHAWTQGEILEMVVELRRQLDWPLEVDFFAKQGCEVMLVLQKDRPVHGDHARLGGVDSTREKSEFDVSAAM